MEKEGAKIEGSSNSKYFSLPSKEVLQKLQSSENGLSSHQAEVRMHKYGLNELKIEKKNQPDYNFLKTVR